MPLENSGKIITKIKMYKTKAVIYFGKDKMDVSLETYSSFYFFVGKEVTKKELNEIKKFDKMQSALKFALSIRKKFIITEWALREKLYAKDFEKGIVDNTIKFLKQNNLIDDDMFIEDYLEYANEECYGKNKIINELQKKGVFPERINRIKFNESKELAKAKILLPKLENKFDRLNDAQKKKHIYDAYLRYGFESNVANQMLVKLKPINETKELEKLRKDFYLYFKKASYKFDDSEKDINEYVRKHLLSKGYKNKDIMIIWEEFRNENGC